MTMERRGQRPRGSKPRQGQEDEYRRTACGAYYDRSCEEFVENRAATFGIGFFAELVRRRSGRIYGPSLHGGGSRVQFRTARSGGCRGRRSVCLIE